MDRKEIMVKAREASILIAKNAKTGFTENNDDGNQVLLLGLELLTNLLVDINRIADAAEKLAARQFYESKYDGSAGPSGALEQE